MNLKVGEKVQYVGLDSKIQQDYGRKQLVISHINCVTELAACKGPNGSWLVGVSLKDLQPDQVAEIS